MKKTLSIFLAVCLCCALAIPAAASCGTYTTKDTVSPRRWDNISSATCAADIIDGYLCIDATMRTYDVMSLRITFTVSAPGITTKTFTTSKTDDYISLYEEIPAVANKTYTVAITYEAGTESHTETIRV